MKWETTSWTYSMIPRSLDPFIVVTSQHKKDQDFLDILM